MGWSVVWILCVFCTVVYQSLADPGSVWTSEETATEKQISPEKEVLNGQTEKPKNDADFNSEISDAPEVHPGDYLFQLSVGMKFVGANFKGFEGMEKRIGRSIKRLVIEKLSTFASFKELFLLTIKRMDAQGLLFVYWLYFSPGTEDNYILIESLMKQLLSKSVSNLRYGKAKIFLISIEDVDECTSGLSTCDPEATCSNAFGLYSCRCPKGFEVSSGISCVKNVKSETEKVSSIAFGLKNCHVTIEGDSSKFRSPVCSHNEYIWCKGTIAASDWESIAVQIRGFLSQGDCNKNQEELFIYFPEHVVQKVTRACLNKGCIVVIHAPAVYVTFSEKRNLNQSKRCLQYLMYNESKTPHASLDVLILSHSRIFQQISAVNGVEVTEQLHMGQAINQLSSEAAATVSQYNEATRSHADSRLSAQPTTKERSIGKSTVGSDGLPVANQGVQMSAEHHTPNIKHVHQSNSLFTQLHSYISSQRRPSNLFEFSHLFSPSLVLAPATLTMGPHVDPTTLTIGPHVDTPTLTMGPHVDTPTLTIGPHVDTPTLTIGPHVDTPTLTMGPHVDTPTLTMGPHVDTPTLTMATLMDTATLEWLARPSDGNALGECNILQALIEGNLGTLLSDIFSHPLTWWQINFSTSGFSATEFQKEVACAQSFMDVKTPVKQSLDGVSRADARGGSECIGYLASCSVVDPQLEVIGTAIGLVHQAIVCGFTQSFVSDSIPDRGSCVHLERGLLQPHARSDGWIAMESTRLSDVWASSSWDVVENLKCRNLGFNRTLPLKCLQAFTTMQSKGEQHVLWESESLMSTVYSRVRDSEMVYSVSLGGMVSSALTPSLHPQSQSLWGAEGTLHTSIYQTTNVRLIVPTHVYTSMKTDSSVETGNVAGDDAVGWHETWTLSNTTSQPRTQDTAKQIDGTSFLHHYTDEPSISQTSIWMILHPKLQDEDIGHLLAVSATVELTNVVFKNFQRLEKRLLQSVQNLIMDNLVSFHPPLKKILPKSTKRLRATGFNFTYELHFGPNGENIQYSVQGQMSNMSNRLVANLTNGQVHLVSISVRDVDECKSKTSACGEEANCLNTIGSYICQCKYGFDADSLGQKPVCIGLDSGFWSAFGLKEMLIASATCALLLVSLALTLCFVMFKRSHKTCDTHPAAMSGRNSSSEELESEESLFIDRHRSVSYISFRKFEPIPEEPSSLETDSDETSNSPGRNRWHFVKMTPL